MVIENLINSQSKVNKEKIELVAQWNFEFLNSLIIIQTDLKTGVRLHRSPLRYTFNNNIASYNCQ